MSAVTEKVATSAAEYAERYRAALDNGSLHQGVWNSERDGRHVACALGVLGDNVQLVGDCPAQVMPRWLAQMVPWLFDTMLADDAFAWGLAFTEQLKRLDGNVPFTVVYDWQGNVACQLGIEAAEKRGRDQAPHKALQELHLRALKGDRAEHYEWFKTLRNAYADANANAYADADANANANADAYADAYAYAYANANANAYAYAYADADAYANAYADAYAYAYANANANAYANAYAYAYADAYAYKKAVKRLADGLVECLARVPS